MNRWENSLYCQRGFAPDLWPGVSMVQKTQITDAQIMTMKTNPVILLTGPPGFLVFPERVWYAKPASPGAYSGVGVTGNLQITWADASAIVATTPTGLLDTTVATFAIAATVSFAAGPSPLITGFGYTGSNSGGVNSNFQRIALSFVTANPVVSGGGVLNVGFTYRLYPLVPSFP